MLSEAIAAPLRTVLAFWEYNQLQENVEGFLLDIQGFMLMLLAEHGPGMGAIVEIGSFKGKSTCWLARGAKNALREKVYAIDHFAGSPEHLPGMPIEDRDIAATGSTFEVFQRNVAQMDLADFIVPIVSSSSDAARAWESPIRLLFIDADHSYEASKLDFDLWSPYVIPGGLVAFHDIGEWDGVTEFYNSEVKTNAQYRELVNVLGLVIVEKVGGGPKRG
jgi:predicted O-methyltransferase YrrM